MNNKFEVVGLMSGTSLDGLDVAFCQFQLENDLWRFDITHAETLPYPDGLSADLRESTTLSGLDLTHLDHRLGAWMGAEVSAFLLKNNLQPTLVASHGHTVFHQPDKGFTLQIGNPHEIMLKTALPVVCDFRSLDVVLGGQGAPLVPIGDKLLFGEFDFCLNLGGISNISFDREEKRVAFDICPVNIVLNHLAQKTGNDYDKDGLLAKKGHFINELYDSLNGLPYYAEPVPKSLGIEWVLKNIFPLFKGFENDIDSLLHTYCRHVAFQIGATVRENNAGKPQKLLITGGGAFNKYLVELIKKNVGDNVTVVVPDLKTVAFKEALIFAFLGLLRWNKQPNILKSVTGARCDSCSGTIINNMIF